MNKVNQDQALKIVKALRESLLEDILAMPDEELLADVRENGLDPTDVAQKLRMNALRLVAQERKKRFSQIRSDFERASAGNRIKKRPPIEIIKRRLEEIFARNPEFSLAFRKGERQSDSDVESLWDNLIELGLISNDVQD